MNVLPILVVSMQIVSILTIPILAFVKMDTLEMVSLAQVRLRLDSSPGSIKIAILSLVSFARHLRMHVN